MKNPDATLILFVGGDIAVNFSGTNKNEVSFYENEYQAMRDILRHLRVRKQALETVLIHFSCFKQETVKYGFKIAPFMKDLAEKYEQQTIGDN